MSKLLILLVFGLFGCDSPTVPVDRYPNCDRPDARCGHQGVPTVEIYGAPVDIAVYHGNGVVREWHNAEIVAVTNDRRVWYFRADGRRYVVSGGVVVVSR